MDIFFLKFGFNIRFSLTLQVIVVADDCRSPQTKRPLYSVSYLNYVLTSYNSYKYLTREYVLA